jgi:hypothetical protein
VYSISLHLTDNVYVKSVFLLIRKYLNEYFVTITYIAGLLIMNHKIIEDYLRKFSEAADNWFKEVHWIDEWYEFYKGFYTSENLKKAEWHDIQNIGNYLHSFSSMAIAKSNALGNINLPIEHYRKVFSYLMSEKDPIDVTIDNLYKKSNSDYFLPFFGDSSTSELVAYAFPEKYVIYNSRSQSALKILGIEISRDKGESFGSFFLRYNNAIEPILAMYESQVGRRTKSSLRLELDQFFSWLYATHKNVDKINDLVKEYKIAIAKNGFKNEKYKWEFILKSEPISRGAQEDVYHEIIKFKFGNLIYPLAIPCLKKIYEKFSIQLNRELLHLMDDEVDLNARIFEFIDNTKMLYIDSGGLKQNHQDERTISAYLTFRNPTKYTFYKSSYYKKYCKLVGEKPKAVGYCYSHYLELLNDLYSNYLVNDSELMSLAKKDLGSLWEIPGSNLLLAQDLLYRQLDQNEELNYWTYNLGENFTDFSEFAQNPVIEVDLNENNIEVGDKVVVWNQNNQLQIYGIGEILQKISENGLEDLFSLKFEQDFFQKPIFISDDDKIDELKDVEFSNNTLIEKLEPFEFVALSKLADLENGSPYHNVKRMFEDTVFNEFLGIIKDFVTNNQIQYKDSRISLNVLLSTNRLVLIIGSRYSLLLELKNKKTVISFIHPKKIIENATTFTNNNKEIQAYWNTISSFEGYEKIISDGLNFELSRNYKNPYRKYSNVNFENDVFNIQENSAKTKSIEMKFPLNTIFYGPPGTGKTYNTILRAAEIVENRKIDEYNEALKIFNENLNNQIEFITFHQNYGYEDFIQGLRPDIENNHQLVFDKKDGIFKQIADRALENIRDSKNSQYSKHSFETVFKEYFLPFNSGEIEEIKVEMKKVSYFVTGISQKSIDFRKASGNSSHSLSISTLKKMYDSESLLDIQGLSSYYAPLLDALLKLGHNNLTNKQKVIRKNYVIVIDEINRANISKVFGELITLIEPDKRSEGSMSMSVKLPSGDTFTVPSNLYIIGTMNTADKSISLLDIALRRRFVFEAMYPLYEIASRPIYHSDILRKINDQIIKLKGYDFQIGHSYFMGENVDLKSCMNYKVIPLLLEYFMNDEKEVKEILIGAGLNVENQTWPLQIQ